MANKFDLDALKASNFEGAARTHVEKAYLLLTGNDPDSVDGLPLEEMRTECQKITALENINKSAPTLADVEAPKKGLGRIPNLGLSGKWEGRMRRVTVHNPDPESARETITVGWEGYPWTIAYGVEVDMPWPYWESLRSAVVRDEGSDKVVTWEAIKGRGFRKVINATERLTHNYTDHGDVPGTESLPTCYSDFFRRKAMETACFKEIPHAMLLRVYEILFDGPPVDRDHKLVQLDHTQLRWRIAQRLGPELVSVMNNEIFEAA